MAFYDFSANEDLSSEMLKKQRRVAQASTWTEELKTKPKLSVTWMNNEMNKA